jgi:hypothetical protein
MEGTNDIDLVQQGLLSIESIRSNLVEMTRRVSNRGAEPILSTLIPRGPRANRDRDSLLTKALNVQIRGSAFQRDLREVENFEAFREAPQPYGTIFYLGSDPVGHPNAAGFELMAQTFADVIENLDLMHPVIGEHQPLSVLQPEVRPGQVFEVFVYDFGEGLDRDSLTLTLNGLPVETDVAGNDRRRLLSHEATNETILCFARLGINAADTADPPNRLEVVVADYERPNAEVRRTDLTKDCRVDGRDVLELAELFGTRQNEFRFDPLLDLNGDKVIDGEDLARIAADFGKTTS